MHLQNSLFNFYCRVRKGSRQIRNPRSMNAMNKLTPALIDERETRGISLCSLTEQLCLKQYSQGQEIV